mmetsp:Transcript_68356/g.211335  ORF Transcript_68356/g.211335 Transcript_68356/m.211335 type:complete len:343 (-) Transcript_68356:65-1093(-)
MHIDVDGEDHVAERALADSHLGDPAEVAHPTVCEGRTHRIRTADLPLGEAFGVGGPALAGPPHSALSHRSGIQNEQIVHPLVEDLEKRDADNDDRVAHLLDAGGNAIEAPWKQPLIVWVALILDLAPSQASEHVAGAEERVGLAAARVPVAEDESAPPLHDILCDALRRANKDILLRALFAVNGIELHLATGSFRRRAHDASTAARRIELKHRLCSPPLPVPLVRRPAAEHRLGTLDQAAHCLQPCSAGHAQDIEPLVVLQGGILKDDTQGGRAGALQRGRLKHHALEVQNRCVCHHGVGAELLARRQAHVQLQHEAGRLGGQKTALQRSGKVTDRHQTPCI